MVIISLVIVLHYLNHHARGRAVRSSPATSSRLRDHLHPAHLRPWPREGV